MNLSESVEQIKQDMLQVGGLDHINIHIQNFEDPEGRSYIEFKAKSSEYEKLAEKLYHKYSKMIRKNHSELSISYNNPHVQHQNNLLRRIIIEINHDTKDPIKKEELLTKATEDFHYIVKRWIKYSQVKSNRKKH